MYFVDSPIKKGEFAVHCGNVETRGYSNRTRFDDDFWEIAYPSIGIKRDVYINLQCEAPKIAKLVNITPISLWFMVLITIVTGAIWGESKPTNITGGDTL